MADNDLERGRQMASDFMRRAEAALADSRGKNAELVQRFKKDIIDPLFIGPVAKVRDLKFLPNGSLDPESIGREIAQWRDAEGNIIYTTQNHMPLDQIRSLRDRVVIQQDALESLLPEEKSKVEAEYKTSGGKSEVSKPFQDYLRSQQLGERFAHLKQNPPRPFGK